MPTNLYEVLGVTKDATTEQIRKAYKKQALKTHPDKLPAGLSEAEKIASAEKFREVSQACEILTDPERRKEYDAHGVWPSPESESDEDFDAFFDHIQESTSGRRSRGFSSPFFASHRQHFRSTHAFRDPFELFDAIFRDFDDLFMTQAAPSTHTFPPFNPLSTSAFQRPRSIFDDPFFGSAPGFPSAIPTFTPMLASSFAHEFGDARGRGHHVRTESYVSHTVNGVTLSTRTRRDKDGNEHIWRKLPDGREVYTVNGVEQPARGNIQQTSHEPRQLSYTQPRHRSTLPSSHFQPQPIQRHQRNFSPQNQVRRDTYSASGEGYHTSPPPYPGNNGSSRMYTRNADLYANNAGGSTQYGERRYPRAPDYA